MNNLELLAITVNTQLPSWLIIGGAIVLGGLLFVFNVYISTQYTQAKLAPYIKEQEKEDQQKAKNEQGKHKTVKPKASKKKKVLEPYDNPDWVKRNSLFFDKDNE